MRGRSRESSNKPEELSDVSSCSLGIVSLLEKMSLTMGEDAGKMEKHNGGDRASLSGA